MSLVCKCLLIQLLDGNRLGTTGQRAFLIRVEQLLMGFSGLVDVTNPQKTLQLAVVRVSVWGDGQLDELWCSVTYPWVCDVCYLKCRVWCFADK
jgi:hypothetical protein